MKKKTIKRRPTFKTRWTQRKTELKEKDLNLAHPVVKASYVWSIVSEQLGDILGPEVHCRWFKEVKPTVISDNILILEVPNHFCAQWIHSHYHELVDVLLSVLDKRLSSFFISQSERLTGAKALKALPEGPTSKVKCQTEDN